MANKIAQDFFQTMDETGGSMILFTNSITHVLPKGQDKCFVYFVGGSQVVVTSKFDDLIYNLTLIANQKNTPLT